MIIEPTVGRTDWQEEIATLLGVNLPLVGYLLGCDQPATAFEPTNVNLVWQASFVQRWKTGPSRMPPDAVVVDGFWRRDDPMPALLHYPHEFVKAVPSLLAAIGKRTVRHRSQPSRAAGNVPLH
jgi:hypothetical protein